MSSRNPFQIWKMVYNRLNVLTHFSQSALRWMQLRHDNWLSNAVDAIDADDFYDLIGERCSRLPLKVLPSKLLSYLLFVLHRLFRDTCIDSTGKLDRVYFGTFPFGGWGQLLRNYRVWDWKTRKVGACISIRFYLIACTCNKPVIFPKLSMKFTLLRILIENKLKCQSASYNVYW